MKYRKIKKSIVKNLEKDMNVELKYFRIRSLFAKQFDKKVPIVKRTNKEKLQEALPTIIKIHLDGDSQVLFTDMIKDGNFEKTQDFIKFLEEISK